MGNTMVSINALIRPVLVHSFTKFSWNSIDETFVKYISWNDESHPKKGILSYSIWHSHFFSPHYFSVNDHWFAIFFWHTFWQIAWYHILKKHILFANFLYPILDTSWVEDINKKASTCPKQFEHPSQSWHFLYFLGDTKTNKQVPVSPWHRWSLPCHWWSSYPPGLRSLRSTGTRWCPTDFHWPQTNGRGLRTERFVGTPLWCSKEMDRKVSIEIFVVQTPFYLTLGNTKKNTNQDPPSDSRIFPLAFRGGTLRYASPWHDLHAQLSMLPGIRFPVWHTAQFYIFFGEKTDRKCRNRVALNNIWCGFECQELTHLSMKRTTQKQFRLFPDCERSWWNIAFFSHQNWMGGVPPASAFGAGMVGWLASKFVVSGLIGTGISEPKGSNATFQQRLVPTCSRCGFKQIRKWHEMHRSFIDIYCICTYLNDHSYKFYQILIINIAELLVQTYTIYNNNSIPFLKTSVGSFCKADADLFRLVLLETQHRTTSEPDWSAWSRTLDLYSRATRRGRKRTTRVITRTIL